MSGRRSGSDRFKRGRRSGSNRYKRDMRRMKEG
jgi:hypothetical protein